MNAIFEVGKPNFHDCRVRRVNFFDFVHGPAAHGQGIVVFHEVFGVDPLDRCSASNEPLGASSVRTYFFNPVGIDPIENGIQPAV